MVYERLLTGQLGRLTVECRQTGVRVRLDGKLVVSCPGKKTTLLLAGEHQVVADRVDYLTLSKSLLLQGGEARALGVALIPADRATVTRRRWATWKPWAVLGGGLALGLVGAAFEAKAGSWLTGYDCEHDTGVVLSGV